MKQVLRPGVIRFQRADQALVMMTPSTGVKLAKWEWAVGCSVGKLVDRLTWEGLWGLMNVYLSWKEQRKAKVYQATLSPYEHEWTKIRARDGGDRKSRK